MANPIMVGGEHIPVPDWDYFTSMYGDEPLCHIKNFRVVRSGILGDKDGFPPGYLYGPRNIVQLISPGSIMPWWNVLAAKLTIPNGQVKNFLVACRTYLGQGKSIRVCIRGSKASSTGGSWHFYYATLLAARHSEVIMDMYDDSEIPDEFIRKEGSNSVHLRWLPKKYFGDGSDYDVLIDDAWDSTTSGPIPLEPKCKYYSLKGSPDQYVPFLHVKETRHFSSPVKGIKVMCTCSVCNVISSFSANYDTYQLVRGFCSSLGFTPQCYPNLAYYDVLTKSNSLKTILANPIFRAFTPSEYRALIVISKELPCEIADKATLVHQPEIGSKKINSYISKVS